MNTPESSYFQPKSLSGLLSSALRETTSHSASGFVTVAAMALPVALISLAVIYAAAEMGVTRANRQAPPPQPGAEWAMLYAVIALACFATMYVVAYFAVASVARLFAERAIGNIIRPADAWAASMRQASNLISGSIYQMLIFAAASMALSLPLMGIAFVLTALIAQQDFDAHTMLVNGIHRGLSTILFAILTAYLCPMPSVCAIERRDAHSSIRRSFGLISGDSGRAFLAILIGTTCVAVFPGLLKWGIDLVALEPLQNALGNSLGAVVAAIPSMLVFVLLVPFLVSLQALIYLDARASKEGPERFTPEVLAGELEEGLPDAAAATAPATQQPDAPA